MARNSPQNLSSCSRTPHGFTTNFQLSSQVSVSSANYIRPIFHATPNKVPSTVHRPAVPYRYIVTGCKVFGYFDSFIGNVQIPALCLTSVFYSQTTNSTPCTFRRHIHDTVNLTNCNMLFPQCTPLQFVPLTQLPTAITLKNLLLSYCSLVKGFFKH